MITGHGVDLVEIERIRRSISRFGPRFFQRLFDPREIEAGKRYRDSAPFFAARFAAKEAFAKAVGTGFLGFGPRDVVVLRDKGAPPRIVFSQKVRNVFPGIRSEEFLLSLSHEKGMAMASVIRSSAF